MAGKGPILCPRDLARALDQGFSKNALIDMLYSAVCCLETEAIQDDAKAVEAIQKIASRVSPARGDKLPNLSESVRKNRESREAWESKIPEREAEALAFQEATQKLKEAHAYPGWRSGNAGTAVYGWWRDARYLGENVADALKALESAQN